MNTICKSSRIQQSISKKRSDSSDIVIVGAGIIGLLTAKQLSEAGLQVTILDRQLAGRESSFAGGGILFALQPWRKATALLHLIRWSLNAYPHLVKQLCEDTGINPEFIRSGIAFIDEPLSAGEQTFLKALFPGYTRSYSEAYSNLFSNVSIESHADIISGVAQIRNPRLLEALKQFITVKCRVNIVEQAEVTKINIKQNQITHVDANGCSYSADQFIFTTGAWSNTLLRQANLKCDIRPIKGQMLRVLPKQPLFQHILVKGDCYLIPRANGKVLIGSTLEDCGFDKTPSTSCREALFNNACKIVPRLSQAKLIDHWAGLRPGTDRNRPIIDKLPNVNNGYVSAGHFRYGLTCAPASASLMTNLVLQREGTIKPEPYQWAAQEEVQLA